jgi:5'-3' exonuclease
MLEEESPIIDFYPTTFEIDMNGKKMAWQGVALLPFIDQQRLLEAMAIDYPKLTEDQVRRNAWGNDVLFVSDEHSLYPFFESLYGKRKNQDVRFHRHKFQSLLNSHPARANRPKFEQRYQRQRTPQSRLYSWVDLLLSSTNSGRARHQERSFSDRLIFLP